LISNISNIWI